MAASILDEQFMALPGGVTLIPSTGGVFEVALGDQTIFSKKATGRFPETDEVETALGKALSG